MRAFQLHRDEDVTGASGTGIVAEGIEFWDGTVALRWFGETPSTVVWPSLDAAIRIHGHDGRTRFVFDPPMHDGVAKQLDEPKVLKIRATGPTSHHVTEVSLDGMDLLNEVVSVHLDVAADQMTKATLVLEVIPDVEVRAFVDAKRRELVVCKHGMIGTHFTPWQGICSPNRPRA